MHKDFVYFCNLLLVKPPRHLNVYHMDLYKQVFLFLFWISTYSGTAGAQSTDYNHHGMDTVQGWGWFVCVCWGLGASGDKWMCRSGSGGGAPTLECLCPLSLSLQGSWISRKKHFWLWLWSLLLLLLSSSSVVVLVLLVLVVVAAVSYKIASLFIFCF